MSKIDLFLDFDNTICNSSKAFVDLYNLLPKYNQHPDFKLADWTKSNDWNFKDVAPLSVHETETLFGNPIFFDLLEFYPNALEVLDKLKEQYNIIIVSIGTYENLQYKSKFINDYLSFCDAILIRNKGLKMDKSKVNMKNGIFIDDNQDNLFSSNASKMFCYSDKIYRWNESWHGDRLLNWLEVEKALL